MTRAASRERMAAAREAVDASCQDGRFGSLMEDIRNQLNQMAEEFNAPRERRHELAAAMGRLVTDSYELMDDPLGSELAELTDAYDDADRAPAN